MSLRMGMIGLGTIGHSVLEALRSGVIRGVECPVILVRHPRGFKTDDTLPVITDDPELFFRFKMDLVLEVAAHEAVREYGERALRHGSDLVLVSTGALAEESLLQRLVAAAQDGGRRIHVPSAGGGALDVMAAGAHGRFGSFSYRQNVAVTEDRAARRLVSMAVIKALRQMTSPLIIGV